eukprot:6487601-Prymnesium_polylepis.1
MRTRVHAIRAVRVCCGGGGMRGRRAEGVRAGGGRRCCVDPCQSEARNTSGLTPARGSGNGKRDEGKRRPTLARRSRPSRATGRRRL